MLYSVFIATLTYVAVAFAAVVSVKAGSPGVSGEVWQWIGSYHEKGFGEAIGRLMPYANFLLTLAVIFASTSALNATIFSAARSSYALGRDNMLPAIMAKISKKCKTPWVALLSTSIIVIFVAVFLDTMDVASSASIMFLFLFFLVNLCVIVIRRNMADELEYGFMMPFFPLLPVVAIICQAILAVHLHAVSHIAWIIGPSWIIAGFLIYYFYSRSHAITTEDEILVIEDEKATKDVGYNYNIMIAVANPENALSLVRNSYKLCGAKKARVELLHMIPVPQQVPLSDADRYMLEGKESIIEMMIYLDPLFPVSTTLRYCRSVARGIVSAAREKKVDMLIMGWRGKTKNQEFSLGSTIDPIIERSPCNVVILKDCGNLTFRRIIVPIAGGPNCGFALEVATILAEKEHSQIVAFNVENENYSFYVDAFLERAKTRLHAYSGDIALKKVKAKNVERAILKEAQHYDLVVIGTTQQPLISQFVKISLPEVIAQKCNKPVVMVKASGGIRLWVKRWI